MNSHDRLIQKLKRETFEQIETRYHNDTEDLTIDKQWFIVCGFGWSFEEFCREKDRRSGLHSTEI